MSLETIVLKVMSVRGADRFALNHPSKISDTFCKYTENDTRLCHNRHPKTSQGPQHHPRATPRPTLTQHQHKL